MACHWLCLFIACKSEVMKGTTMFEVLKARVAIWRRRNETIAELRALTDRELLDMGISRWDIDRIANQASQPRR
jgi:uncharacterized protein YjiS (DUF1127 family)